MMSEKIVITVEQEGRIKHFIENKVARSLLTCGVTGFTSPDNKCLNTIDVDQMARILYEPNSYEVEKPKFEVGNIVVGIQSDILYRITRIKSHDTADAISIKINNQTSNINLPFMRHATKEEIMWAELGRDYRETKIGDCISLNGEYLKVQENMGCERYKNHISHLFAKGILISGHSDGFYPANSFIKLP